jgi:hypothetical protein
MRCSQMQGIKRNAEKPMMQNRVILVDPPLAKSLGKRLSDTNLEICRTLGMARLRHQLGMEIWELATGRSRFDWRRYEVRPRQISLIEELMIENFVIGFDAQSLPANIRQSLARFTKKGTIRFDNSKKSFCATAMGVLCCRRDDRLDRPLRRVFLALKKLGLMELVENARGRAVWNPTANGCDKEFSSKAKNTLTVLVDIHVNEGLVVQAMKRQLTRFRPGTLAVHDDM